METATDLRGARVLLTPVTPGHHERLREIHRLPEVRRWWQDPSEHWPDDEPDSTNYTVFVDDRIIGFVQWYCESDPDFSHAGLDIFVDPAVHGRGLGTEIVRVVCAHLIDDHHFHRLIIDPESVNAAAIACYRKVGFRDVGIMRKYSRDRHGVWHDGLLMDLLADEFVR